jgi:large subunit ribosomal protein L25
MAKKTASVGELTIEHRDHTGTSSARAVRHAGKIPGVLYGHGAPNPIAIEAKALEGLLLSGGKSHIVDATIDGVHDSVLLREVQRDPITHRPIHADFQRVTKGEAITASVSIVTTGTPVGVKDEGGVLDFVTRSIDVKGPADKIPESIEIDVAPLNVGEHISASQVPLPAGFTLLTPSDSVILSVEGSRTAQEAEEAAPAVEPVPVAAAPEATT